MPDDHAAGINSLGLLRDLNRRRAAATLEDDDDIRERLEDEEERQMQYILVVRGGHFFRSRFGKLLTHAHTLYGGRFCTGR